MPHVLQRDVATDASVRLQTGLCGDPERDSGPYPHVLPRKVEVEREALS